MTTRAHSYLRTVAALGAALVVTVLVARPADAASPASPAAVPGELLVGFRDGTSADRRRALRHALGLRRIRPLAHGARADLVAVPERATAQLVARADELEGEPGVAYAEPNWVLAPDRLPSDGFFLARQWDLRNTGSFLVGNPGSTVHSTAGADIDAPRAWDLTTGSPNAVIAVVDSGVYDRHWDLDRQIWSNPGERFNGVDDDRNGRVDDLHGWDFASADADPDDSDGHGTHVAGIADAEADGRGTVGVAWNARVMPVRVMGGDPQLATAARVAEGLRYAAAEGAHVVTMSFGASAESTAITDAIADHPQALFVASAGNTGANNDINGWFPCNSEPSNIVCVASSDQDDHKATESAYGPTNVDLAAPGTLIVGPDGDPRTRGPGNYVSRSGTSLAVPHVAGIAALIKSLEPWHGALAQKGCILAGVDRTEGLTGLVATGGRANARRALEACGDPAPPEVPPVQIAPPDGALVRPEALSFRFTPGRDRLSGVAGNSIVLDGRTVARGPASVVALAPSGRIADGRHSWVVRSTDGFGHVRDSGRRSVIVDGTPPRLKLRIRRRSAARGIRARATVSEAVTIASASVKLSRKVAGRLRTRKRTLRARATRRLGSGTTTLAIKLPRAIRRRGAGQRVRVDLRLVDDAGNAGTKRFSVRLR